MRVPDKSRATAAASIVDRHVGGQLRAARESLGESPAAIAARLEVSVAEYLEWEAGSRRLEIGTMMRAVEVLKVEVSWFFKGLASSALLDAAAPAAPAEASVQDMDREVARQRREALH